LRLAVHAERITGRHVEVGHEPPHIVRRLVERMAGGDVALDVDRELSVLPAQLRRPETADHLGDVVDPDLLAGGRRDGELADRVDVAPLASRARDLHRVLLAAVPERRISSSPDTISRRRRRWSRCARRGRRSRPIHRDVHSGLALLNEDFASDDAGQLLRTEQQLL
jgi:hypothetical protein